MPGRAEGGAAVAVVIPAYQAATTIADVVSRTHRAVPNAIVYVVDDGSSDGTGAKAEKMLAGRGRRTRGLTHPRNRGKGAAPRTGIAAARQDGPGGSAALDAPRQHHPEVDP